MNGAVSRSLWIYFVLMISSTAAVVAICWFLDHRTVRVKEEIEDTENVHEPEEDKNDEEAEDHMNRLETQIMARIRKRTGATWKINTSLTAQTRAPEVK